MKLTNEELEELLSINYQAKALVNGLDYCDELGKELFNCMNDKMELSEEGLKHAHNNYLALFLIGLNQCKCELFEKLDKYVYGF